MIEHSDILTGAYEIAEYLFGERSPKHRRRVYYLAETRELPIFRLGGILTARKSTLSRAYEERERAAQCSEPQTASAAGA